MNIPKIYFLILIPLFTLISCNKEKQQEEDPHPRILFSKSAEIIKEYTNKIKMANDTATIDSLSAAYDKKLTEVNFSMPFLTDLKLTEQENDSLKKLIALYVKTKKDRMTALARHNINKEDTVHSDINKK